MPNNVTTDVGEATSLGMYMMDTGTNESLGCVESYGRVLLYWDAEWPCVEWYVGRWNSCDDTDHSLTFMLNERNGGMTRFVCWVVTGYEAMRVDRVEKLDDTCSPLMLNCTDVTTFWLLIGNLREDVTTRDVDTSFMLMSCDGKGCN